MTFHNSWANAVALSGEITNEMMGASADQVTPPEIPPNSTTIVLTYLPQDPSSRLLTSEERRVATSLLPYLSPHQTAQQVMGSQFSMEYQLKLLTSQISQITSAMSGLVELGKRNQPGTEQQSTPLPPTTTHGSTSRTDPPSDKEQNTDDYLPSTSHHPGS